MALTQVDFEDCEENIIKKIMQKFSLNKPKAVRKIVSEYKIKNGK